MVYDFGVFFVVGFSTRYSPCVLARLFLRFTRVFTQSMKCGYLVYRVLFCFFWRLFRVFSYLGVFGSGYFWVLVRVLFTLCFFVYSLIWFLYFRPYVTRRLPKFLRGRLPRSYSRKVQSTFSIRRRLYYLVCRQDDFHSLL